VERVWELGLSSGFVVRAFFLGEEDFLGEVSDRGGRLPLPFFPHMYVFAL
jgi:hypothetical protein